MSGGIRRAEGDVNEWIVGMGRRKWQTVGEDGDERQGGGGAEGRQKAGIRAARGGGDKSTRMHGSEPHGGGGTGARECTDQSHTREEVQEDVNMQGSEPHAGGGPGAR